MFHAIEEMFKIAVQYGILILEAIGAVIIFISALRTLLGMLQKKHDSKIQLAEGIATALSFLLGSEALKTIIAPDWKDIGMTCAILLMRAAMSLLIHWETKAMLQIEKEEESIMQHSKTGGAEIGE
jgi:uncharacterized membrane protein